MFLAVGAGGKLPGDAQTAPWLTLASVMATNHLQACNWNPDCLFPPETGGEKGIEGAPASGLRALVAQFRDKEQPVSFQKLENRADQQGECRTGLYFTIG